MIAATTNVTVEKASNKSQVGIRIFERLHATRENPGRPPDGGLAGIST